MSGRDDDTPTSPDVAARLARIAARIRRRSTRTTEIARLRAYEILVALGCTIDDPRSEQVTLIVRAAVEQGIDAAHVSLTRELAEAEAELERLRAIVRADLRRRSDER